jgi:hypothetical protein
VNIHGAAALAALLIAFAAAASDDVAFCSNWKRFDRDAKADFIVIQSQAYLTQWKPTHWIRTKSCFRRRAPRWLYRIDEACSIEDPTNFDVGMTMGALVATMFVQCSAELPAGAGGASADEVETTSTEYKSSSGHYSIRYGSAWSVSTGVREPGVDMALLCTARECGGGSTISFGVRYDPQAASASTDQMLSLANSKILTAQVRNSPLVSSVEVHEEGKATLGALPAYHVRMTVRFFDGRTRIRHSFFTVSRGYWYNVSLHADPEKYNSARSSAQQVLSTFSLL